MKYLKILFSLLIIFSIYNCSTKNTNNENPPKVITKIIRDTIIKEIEKKYSYSDLQTMLYKKEKELFNYQNEDFISGSYSSQKKLFSDNFNIDFEITNKAIITIFKDFKFRINFIAPSGTNIGSETITIYEKCYPQQTIKYHYSTQNAPEQTEKVNIEILEYQVAGKL